MVLNLKMAKGIWPGFSLGGGRANFRDCRVFWDADAAREARPSGLGIEPAHSSGLLPSRRNRWDLTAPEPLVTDACGRSIVSLISRLDVWPRRRLRLLPEPARLTIVGRMGFSPELRRRRGIVGRNPCLGSQPGKSAQMIGCARISRAPAIVGISLTFILPRHCLDPPLALSWRGD